MSVGELIAAVREAFSKEMQPKRFTVVETQFLGWSDIETRRAETVFASRDPETLQATDLGIGAGWPEVYLSEPGLHYYMLGLFAWFWKTMDYPWTIFSGFYLQI